MITGKKSKGSVNVKILITGANGMLAKSVRKRLEQGNELICTDVADLDIIKQRQQERLWKKLMLMVQET